MFIPDEYSIVLSNLSARNNLAMGGGAAVQKLEYASSNLICMRAQDNEFSLFSAMTD